MRFYKERLRRLATFEYQNYNYHVLQPFLKVKISFLPN